MMNQLEHLNKDVRVMSMVSVRYMTHKTADEIVRELDLDIPNSGIMSLTVTETKVTTFRRPRRGE